MLSTSMVTVLVSSVGYRQTIERFWVEITSRTTEYIPSRDKQPVTKEGIPYRMSQQCGHKKVLSKARDGLKRLKLHTHTNTAWGYSSLCGLPIANVERSAQGADFLCRLPTANKKVWCGFLISSVLFTNSQCIGLSEGFPFPLTSKLTSKI